MANLLYSPGQTQTFDPATDLLVFPPSIGASELVLEQAGPDLRVWYGGTAMTLVNVTLAQLASANFSFENGSRLLFQWSDGASLAGSIGGDQIWIDGSAASNVYAGLGNDLVVAGDAYGGSDIIAGGPGYDTLVLSGAYAGMVHLGTAGIERLVLETGALQLHLDDSSFAGVESGITMDASGLQAGAGLDLDAGSVTADIILGLRTVHVTSAGGADSLVGGAGHDWMASGDGDDTLRGGDGDDTLSAGIGADQLWGGVGNDALAGEESADTLYGETGADLLSGGAAGDQLFGGDGDDTLVGGLDADLLTGGAGNDRFQFSLGSPRTDSSQTTIDTVVDFQTGDLVDLPGISDFSGKKLVFGGELAFSTDFTSGTAGLQDTRYAGNSLIDVYWRNATGGVIVWADGNDDGQFSETDLFVFLQDRVGLSLADFADNFLVWRDDFAVDFFGVGTEGVNIDGNNEAYGLGGNDAMSGELGSDALSGGAGSDTLAGGSGDDSLYGGAQDDSLAGGTGADILHGGAGADTLVGGDDNDQLYAEGVSDAASQASSSDASLERNVLSGEGGNDFLGGGAGVDWLDGGLQDDSLRGEGGDDTLLGGDGNDQLLGGAGFDQLDGSTGNDRLDVGTGSYRGESVDTLAGGEGDDRLVSSQGGDRGLLAGGAGADQFWIADPDLYAWYGWNIAQAPYSTVASADRIVDFNEAEGDRIHTGIAGGTTTGGVPLVWRGAAGAAFTAALDQSLALAGSDPQDTRFLEFWTVQDAAARQTLLFMDRNRNFTVDGDDLKLLLDWGATPLVLTDTSLSDGTFVVRVGTSGNDGDTAPVLHEGADLAYGLAGNDTLDGLDGNDILNGDGGNDALTGGGGVDTLYGGAGDDALAGGVAQDFLYGGSGGDTLDGGDDGDRLESEGALDATGSTGGIDLSTDLNALYGRAGSDTLQGGAGRDWLDGGLDDDTLSGAAGQDTLLGGAGNDELWVGGGSTRGEATDALDGGEGDDRLMAHFGGDAAVLTGGAGADAFWLADPWLYSMYNYNIVHAPYSTVAAPDRITDFQEVEGDRLISGIVHGRSSSNVPLVWRGAAAAGFTAVLDQSLALAGSDPADTRFLEFWTLQDAAAQQTVLFLDRNRNFTVDGDDLKLLLDWGGATPLALSASSFSAGTFVVKVGTAGDDLDTAPLLDAGDDLAYGLGGNDSLDGLDGNDTLNGDGGSDTLQGGLGADTLFGGADPDLLLGGAGQDVLQGGSGQDTLYGGDDADQLSAAGEQDHAGSAGGLDAADDRNALYGEAGNDTLVGGAGRDWLDGGLDHDTLIANGGEDTLVGGAGDDELWAGNGNARAESLDSLEGGDGNDRLYASWMGDRAVMTGNTGADQFWLADPWLFNWYHYNIVHAPFSTAAAPDRITDFNELQGDRIHSGITNGRNAGGSPLLWRGLVAAPAAGEAFTATVGQSVALAGSDPSDPRFVEFWMVLDAAARQTVVFMDRNHDFVVDGEDLKLVLDWAGTEPLLLSPGSFSEGTFLAKLGTTGDDTDTTPALGDGADLAYAFAGNDSLDGLEGNDTLNGDAGNDTLSGGFGADVLHGGAGADSLLGASGMDLLQGGSGSDTLDGGDDGDHLSAEGDEDEAHSASGHDAPTDSNTLYGRAGNDTLLGGAAPDWLDGGGDDDWLNGQGGDDTLLGNDGQDQLDGGAGADLQEGGAGNDTLYGGTGAQAGESIDTLVGGDGDDALFSTPWGDRVVMTGGLGADRFWLADPYVHWFWNLDMVQSNFSPVSAPDRVTDFDPLAGDRIGSGLVQGLSMYGAPLVWRGATGALFTASGGASDFSGQLGQAVGGADLGAGVFQLWTWQDTGTATTWLFLDRDLDFVVDAQDLKLQLDGLLALDEASFTTGTFAASHQIGTGGADQLAGTGFDDLMVGGNDGDALAAGLGDDSLYGGAGDDTLDGGPGLDQLLGGAGNDSLLGGDDADTLHGGSGADTLQGGAGQDQLHADGSEDHFAAGAQDAAGTLNWLHGGAGDDYLWGGAGNDRLAGDESNDRLMGAGGSDTLDGGTGVDELYGDDGDDVLVYDPDDARVDGSWGIDLLLLDAYETVDLANGDDQVAGGGIAIGFEGVDYSRLTAAVMAAGNDEANLFIGTAGGDNFQGLGGNDTLAGGGGDDTLHGGAGADEFRYGGVGEGVDRIEDFGFGDRIAVIGALAAGALQASASGSDTLLSIDTDGIAGAEVQVLLAGSLPAAAFQVQVNGDGTSWVSLQQAPLIATDQHFSYDENSTTESVVGTVVASDPNGVAEFAFVGSGTSTSADGAFSIDAQGAVRLTASGAASWPNDFESEPNSHIYQVQARNGLGFWSEAVAITLDEQDVWENRPPTAVAALAATEEDVPLAGQVAGEDPDGSALSYFVDSGPWYGHLAFAADGSWVYTPNANFHGTDSFSFQASDGTFLSDVKTVTVTVTPVNDQPLAFAASEVTDEDQTFAGQVQGSDTDGDPLTFGVVVGATHGMVVTQADGRYTYTPNPDFHGSDSFTFSASDATAQGQATVTLSVRSLNDAPQALDGNVVTNAGQQVGGAVMANDVDGDPLAYSLFAGASHGSVTVAPDGSYSYTPDAGFTGTDSFAFLASDGIAQDSGVITVGVAAAYNSLHGMAYNWKSHALLSGVQLLGASEAAVLPGPELIDLRDMQFDAAGGTITLQVWANPVSASAALAFNVRSTTVENISFASALGSGWTVDVATPVPGHLSVGATLATGGITQPLQLGTLTLQVGSGAGTATVEVGELVVGPDTHAGYSVGFGGQATGADGGYEFSGMPEGGYLMTASRATLDSANAVTSADALAALRMAVGVNPNPDPDGTGPRTQLKLSPYQFIAADANQDGKITSADALAILRMAVKSTLAPPSQWDFVSQGLDLWNEAGAAGGTSLLTRLEAGWDHALNAQPGQAGTFDIVGVLRGDVNGSWTPPAGSQVLPDAYFQELALQLGVPTDVWGI